MKISQREARRLRKRVAELEGMLEQQLNAWRTDWPSGINIDTVSVKPDEFHIVSTARKLSHAVVVVPRLNGNDYQFLVYACQLPKIKD